MNELRMSAAGESAPSKPGTAWAAQASPETSPKARTDVESGVPSPVSDVTRLARPPDSNSQSAWNHPMEDGAAGEQDLLRREEELVSRKAEEESSFAWYCALLMYDFFLGIPEFILDIPYNLWEWKEDWKENIEEFIFEDMFGGKMKHRDAESKLHEKPKELTKLRKKFRELLACTCFGGSGQTAVHEISQEQDPLQDRPQEMFGPHSDKPPMAPEFIVKPVGKHTVASKPKEEPSGQITRHRLHFGRLPHGTGESERGHIRHGRRQCLRCNHWHKGAVCHRCGLHKDADPAVAKMTPEERREKIPMTSEEQLLEAQAQLLEAQNAFTTARTPWFIALISIVLFGSWFMTASFESAKDRPNGRPRQSGHHFSNMQGGLETLLPGNTTLRVHEECIDYRISFWLLRCWSYQFTHTGFSHVLANVLMTVFIGIGVERLHGTYRMICFWFFGVIGGAANFFLFDAHGHVVGASGGVYAILGMRIAYVFLNWSEKRQPWLETFFLAAFFRTITTIIRIGWKRN
jgi:membrane associated rhomboid family serine protease